MTIFFHVAGMGNWQQVVHEINSAIFNSELYDKTDRMIVSFIGTNEDYFTLSEIYDSKIVLYDKVEVIHSSTNLKEYEYPSIKLLQTHCKRNPEDIVLYIHTKGVSKPEDTQKKYWRKAMVKYVITDWKKCVDYLNDYEAVGYNLTFHGRPNSHFSGNFWWAKASAINKSKPIYSFITNPVLINPVLDAEERRRLQPEFFMHELNLNCKSVGVEQYDCNIVPTCIELDNTGDQDPFEYAGIETGARFLLNLETRPDKRRKSETLFKFHKIDNVMPLSGLNAKVLGVKSDKLPLSGITGCYLSWLMTFNFCKALGYETVLMFEDDVIFSYGFKELLKENWKNVPEDWDMVWIGGNERYSHPGKKIAGNVYIPKDIWGTHCMIYSKSGIEKITRHLNNKEIGTDVDIEVHKSVPGLNQYSFFPPIAHQNPNSSSDIRS